jgi:hypothetical protein
MVSERHALATSNKRINAMELGTIREATGCAATREPRSITWNTKAH